MNSELEGYLDQLLSIRQDAPGIIEPLSPQQANWRPAPNRWSVAECFDHLNVSARQFMPAFDELRRFSGPRNAAISGRRGRSDR